MEDESSTAIVVAHVACEAAVTRCIGRQLSHRGNEDLVAPVLDAMSGHALLGRANRTLYRALTGDEELTKQAFWKPYKSSVEQRNQIVHSGSVYGRSDAEECLEAATAFVAYLREQAYSSLRSGSDSGASGTDDDRPGE